MYKTVCTRGINELIKKDALFNAWVTCCMDSFFAGDFGSCSDPEQNTDDYKFGVYTNHEDVTIWIIQNYDVVTVLLPEEY